MPYTFQQSSRIDDPLVSVLARVSVCAPVCVCEQRLCSLCLSLSLFLSFVLSMSSFRVSSSDGEGEKTLFSASTRSENDELLPHRRSLPSASSSSPGRGCSCFCFCASPQRSLRAAVGWIAFSVCFNLLNTIVYSTLFPKVLSSLVPKSEYSSSFATVNTVTTLASALVLPYLGATADLSRTIYVTLVCSRILERCFALFFSFFFSLFYSFFERTVVTSFCMCTRMRGNERSGEDGGLSGVMWNRVDVENCL